MKKTPVFEYYPDTTTVPITLSDGSKRSIVINPGWAFGKGFHPTTQLCIKVLENLFSKEDSGIDSMLDVGCGSGILAICAGALGAKKLTGLDIDNIIVSEARKNVCTNGLEQQIDIVLGSVEDLDSEYDLVTANVLIGSMLPMSEGLKNRTKAGGLMLLSGIKSADSNIVLSRFTEFGFNCIYSDSDKEWSAFLLRAEK